MSLNEKFMGILTHGLKSFKKPTWSVSIFTQNWRRWIRKGSELRDLHTAELGDVKRMNNFLLTKYNMGLREPSLLSSRMASLAWENGPCMNSSLTEFMETRLIMYDSWFLFFFCMTLDFYLISIMMLCFLILLNTHNALFLDFFFFFEISLYLGIVSISKLINLGQDFDFCLYKLKWVSLNLLICNLDFKHWIYVIVPVEDLASFVKWQILNFGAIINVCLELHGFTCYFS